MTFDQMTLEVNARTIEDVNSYAKEVSEIYEDAYKSLKRRLELFQWRLETAALDEIIHLTSQSERMIILMDQIKREYLKFAKLANIRIAESSLMAFSNSFYYNQYTFAWFLPVAESPVILTFAALNENLAMWSTFGTKKYWQAIRHKEAIIGLKRRDPDTLIMRLLKRNRKDLDRIRTTISSGLIQGQSLPNITKVLRNQINISKNNAMRIVRTEVHRNLNAGDYTAFKEAEKQGAKARRQIRAVLDTRTRPQSAQMDGQFADKKDYFHYPTTPKGSNPKAKFPGSSGYPGYDINDREYIKYVVKGLGSNTRRARNPVTGENEIASFDTFDDYMKKHNLEWSKTGKLRIKET